MLSLAILTNISISVGMIILNTVISLKYLREITAIINQKGGGKLVTSITYVFVTKFALLLLAVFASGASPFTNFALLLLNLSECRFTKPKFKKK